MNKRILFAGLLTAILLNSCAIFIYEDDNNEHSSTNKSSDTVTVTNKTNSGNIFEP